MLVVFRIRILSSDIRKFHYGHQIHRTNMNEHWLNCLYTRVKPALNKNLTCHLLFDIFQTFSNNRIFLEIFFLKIFNFNSLENQAHLLSFRKTVHLGPLGPLRFRPFGPSSFKNDRPLSWWSFYLFGPVAISHFKNDYFAQILNQNPKLAWISEKAWNF